MKRITLFLVLFTLLASRSAVAETMYWRSKPITDLFSNKVNWVTNPAEIDLEGAELPSNPDNYPGMNDDVYFTVPSTVTTLKGTASMRSVICTAEGVTFTLPNATIYGNIQSNGNLRVTGAVTMAGSDNATVDLGTSDIIVFGVGTYFPQSDFLINKSGGAKVDLLSDLNRTGNITHTTGNFNSNGYDITATYINTAATTAGTVNLSAGTTLTLTSTTYSNTGISSLYQADFPDCDVIYSNSIIFFYCTSVQFKSLTALHSSALTLLDNQPSNLIDFSVGDLISHTPVLIFGATSNLTNCYFGEITISGKLELKQATNIVINKDHFQFTTPVPVNINSIVLPEDADCAKRSALIGFIPVTLKATGNPISTSNLMYQNITFDPDGAAFTASKADDGGLNSGNITWTPAASTNYCWIGGTGDWSDPTHWAVGSFTGSPNGCIPSAVDNVFFGTDASDYTVTLSVSAGCNHISWVDAAKRGTLAASDGASLSIRGSVDFSGAKAVDPTLYFLGSDDNGSYTLESGDEPVYNSPNIFFWHQGTYILASDFKMIAKNPVDHASGTLVSGGYTLDIGRFASNYAYPIGATRTLNLSGSTLNCTWIGSSTGSRPYSIYLSKVGMDSYDFSGSHFRLINDNLQIMRVEGGSFVFNDISFDSNSPDNVLNFDRLGNTINHLTFTNSGTMGANGFTVETLELTPFHIYTFPDRVNDATGRTVTITGDLISTSGCETITINGINATTNRGIIKNASDHPFSIPGAIIKNIEYIGRDGETDDALAVPGGIDGGGNVNVTITDATPRVFYWIGDGGDWSDPAHWSFTSGEANNLSNCLPSSMDTVYFDGGSFSKANQVVTLDNTPISIASMFWLPGAGAQTPQLNFNTKTLNLSGSMTLAQGMTTAGAYPSTVNFTGTKTEAYSQVINGNGVDIAGVVSITGSGRFDLDDELNIRYQLTIKCGSFYTHGNDIRVDGVNLAGAYCTITQSATAYYDLSSSTITAAGHAMNMTLTINNCDNFLSEESSLVKTQTGYSLRINNSCPVRFKEIIHTETFTCSTTNLVTTEKLTTTGSPSTITGLIETDIWDIKKNATLAANTQVTVNKEILTYGTPCAYSTIQGTNTTTSKLKLTYCNPELHFLYMQNIIAELLPADQCDGEPQVLKVYGQALSATNSPNITFLPTVDGTELFVYDPYISACNPYELNLVRGNPTSFQWWKDGVMINGATSSTYLATEPGVYELYASFSTGCTSHLQQRITFDTDRTWTALGAANDWNDAKNWEPKSVPDLCSYVIIPGGKTHYPILQAEQEEEYAAAKCDTIEFRFGSEVENTHHLTYTSAKVELALNSNQWHTLSAPLHNMYTGDFYVTDPNPVTDGYFMEPMMFNAVNPQLETVHTYTWTGRFNTADIEYQPGQGFALWIDERGTDYIDHNVTSMWFPKEDTFYHYYNYGGGIIGQTGTLARAQNGHFIYEPLAADGNVPLAATACDAVGQSVLVGNPFMAHLNFQTFAARNTTQIENQFKLPFGVSSQDGKMNALTSYLWDSGSQSYISTSDEDDIITMIAPMQSFILTSKVVNPTIVAHSELDTETLPGNTLRSASAPSQPANVLSITATRGEQSNRTLVLYRDYAANAYRPAEDSYALFSESSLEPALIYSRSKDGYALDINSIGDCKETVPLGIRTSQQGAITLNFAGMDSFDDTDIYLIDTYANHRINLSTNNSYRFDKSDDALYLDDRFYLSFVSRSTTGMDTSAATFSIYNQGSDIHVLNPSGGTLRAYIYSVSGNCLLQEEVSGYKPTIHTRLSQGVYIIKLISEKEVSTKTITIK